MALAGSSSYVVRDVTDINHPFTMSTLGGLQPVSGPNSAYLIQFASPSDVSYYADTAHILRKPFDGSAVTAAIPCTNVYAFAWSPDGSALAYLTNAADFSVSQVHLVSGGVDRLVGTVTELRSTGCESPVCAVNWQISLLFSPDGRYVSLVSSPRGQLRIWTSTGALVESVDGSPTMQVWSGTTLYWRDDKGVEVWRDGIQQLLVPGVIWINPHASPAGGQIVYQTSDAGSFTAHVHLLDTATGKHHEVASSKGAPAFLTPHYIWYQGENPCSGSCPYGPYPVASGVNYIYDLQTGTEYRSVISNVYDVWPHPA